MLSIFRLLTSLPAQLILCLLFGIAFGAHISFDIASILYTTSCFIKDILMYLLPFVIFTYLWAALAAFGNRGFILIIITFCLIVVANACSLLAAYGIGSFILPSIVDGAITRLAVDESLSVRCLWALPEWNIIKPVHGMLGGIALGFYTMLLKSSALNIKSIKMRDLATKFLKRGFIPFLPLYVLGFLIKLSRDGHLSGLMHGYAHTFLFSCVLIVIYLVFWYYVGSYFNTAKLISSIREMFPAGITGLTTMSSSATMPVTLDATERNIKDREFADFIIPTSVNSHLPGDGISITLTAMALLLMSGQGLPTWPVFLLYTMHYCLVKFSAAGVPGGGVIVILPVVRDYLGLDETATTLLATIYVLQDPILTSANVMGNGAFAMVTHRLLKPLLKKEKDFISASE
ncbi:MAG: cation:dicarboxylase symporter family transporter [Candidatus Paracaedibacteraceae bacterium]|nr:cation:dicarboxylase symporter family transporter [Candidatus Paracaedibacteraceae bacterium]